MKIQIIETTDKAKLVDLIKYCENNGIEITPPPPMPVAEITQAIKEIHSKDNMYPECGEESVQNCKCFRKDSTCKNKHTWHTCTVHHIKVKGHSDHSVPTNICTCGG